MHHAAEHVAHMQSAGCSRFALTDDETGDVIAGLLMYPTDAPASVAQLGPFSIELASDAPISAGSFPLLLISHGGGGSNLAYCTTAAYLARHGFIVALPEHPGNTWSDNARANTLLNLELRPRHVRLVIDWAAERGPFAASIMPATVAILGHSMGGYTALAAAGGRPTALARETADGQPRSVAVIADERVRALVLCAPAVPWFSAPDALAAVRVPILLFTGENDDVTPGWNAEIITRGVPDPTRVDHRIIANAGHFAFLSPFPPALTSPGFAPSQDPPGFDRARFNAALNAEILAFLRRVI
jgi:predicted dienelactone hydrolase